MRRDGLFEWINCSFSSNGQERMLRRRRQPLTELEVEWGSHQEKRWDLKILTQANQSLSNLKSTTERGRPSFHIMNQIRQKMALRKDVPDPVNLNGFWWERHWMDTEDSDGLTKKKTLRNRESSGTKAHFTGTLPVYPRRDGLTQGQMERLEGNWQDEWQTEKNGRYTH